MSRVIDIKDGSVRPVNAKVLSGNAKTILKRPLHLLIHLKENVEERAL